MVTPDVLPLASDIGIVMALPAIAPAAVVVGVVLFIVMRDRRSGDADADDAQPLGTSD